MLTRVKIRQNGDFYVHAEVFSDSALYEISLTEKNGLIGHRGYQSWMEISQQLGETYTVSEVKNLFIFDSPDSRLTNSKQHHKKVYAKALAWLQVQYVVSFCLYSAYPESKSTIYWWIYELLYAQTTTGLTKPCI